MPGTPRIDDQFQQIARLEARIRVLEQAFKSRALEFTAASTMSLGPIDGNNITGVRIGLQGRVSSPGSFIRLKINALSSLSGQQIQQIVYWDGSAMQTATRFSADIGTDVGLPIASFDWGTPLNDLAVDGVFFTKTGSTRFYQGLLTNNDPSSDYFLSGRQTTRWHDATTVVSSLTITLDSGTFTGRVNVEIVP